MKKLIFLSLIILSSCGKSRINFTVKNNSDIVFDSVVVSGLGRFKIVNFQPNTEVFDFIDWSNSKTRTDGGYQIKLYENGTIRYKAFGYFSNGIPSDSKYYIEVQKDTIIVKAITEKHLGY